MKKLIFTATALLILAGSTFQVPAVNGTQIATVKPTKPTPGPSPDAIPPPTCPANDPNGCGIFD